VYEYFNFSRISISVLYVGLYSTTSTQEQTS
jgi:hypothetical protein